MHSNPADPSSSTPPLGGTSRQWSKGTGVTGEDIVSILTAEETKKFGRLADGRQYQEFCDELSRKNEERYQAEHPESVYVVGNRKYFTMPFSEIHLNPPPSDGDCWGPWKYHRDIFTLCYAPRDHHWGYEIDLERCSTSAEMLDWIFQVSNKVEWCVNREDIGQLIQALQDLMCPQATLCSFGTNNKTLDVATYLRKHTESKSQKEQVA